MKTLLFLIAICFQSISSFSQSVQEIERRFKLADCPVTINELSRDYSPRYKFNLVESKLLFTALDSFCMRNFCDFDANPEAHTLRPVMRFTEQSEYFAIVVFHSNFAEVADNYFFLVTLTPNGDIIDHIMLSNEDSSPDFTLNTEAEFETETNFKINTYSTVGTLTNNSEQKYKINDSGKIIEIEE